MRFSMFHPFDTAYYVVYRYNIITFLNHYIIWILKISNCDLLIWPQIVAQKLISQIFFGKCKDSYLWLDNATCKNIFLYNSLLTIHVRSGDHKPSFFKYMWGPHIMWEGVKNFVNHSLRIYIYPLWCYTTFEKAGSEIWATRAHILQVQKPKLFCFRAKAQ